MKRIILISALLLTASLSAQVYRNSKFWSMALNVGGHTLHSHLNTSSIKFYQPSHIHLNGHYKFNHIFGIRPNINFHNMIMDQAPNIKYANFTIDGTIDFNQISTFGYREQLYETSVLGHIGYGFSTMWKDRVVEGDPYIQGNDDMMVISFGVTPRMRISKNMLLNFDLTYATHIFQDQFYDWTARKDRGFGGGFLRFSFGLTYEFIP